MLFGKILIQSKGEEGSRILLTFYHIEVTNRAGLYIFQFSPPPVFFWDGWPRNEYNLLRRTMKAKFKGKWGKGANFHCTWGENITLDKKVGEKI